MANKIQIKRSTAATGPGTVLDAGELAYSYVSNKLFVGNSGGVGNPAHIIFGGNTGDINFVGVTAGAGLTGTKLTLTGDHTQTLAIDKTASIHMGGISCDGGFTLASGASVSGIGVNDLDDVNIGISDDKNLLTWSGVYWANESRNSWLSPVTVSSFNGSTGAVTGVASFNGSTGAVTFNSNVTSFNGSTGAVTGVSSFNGSTGAVDVTSSQTLIGGVTLGGGGVTFSNKLGLTASSFIMFPDGTTQGQGAITRYTCDTQAVNSVDVHEGGNYSNILDIASEDFAVTVNSGSTTVGTEYAVQYTLSAGSNIAKLNGSSQAWTGALGNVFTKPIGTSFYAAGTATEVLKSILNSSATHMGVTAGEISFKVSGTDILKLDTDIHAKVGISADAGATFGGAVTATSFAGALTGNVTGNASGTSATVTTAAQGNITSVGTLTALTMGGELSCVDNLVTRPVLKDYSETVNAITWTNPTDIDFEDGNVQTLTVLFAGQTVQFSNPPATGTAGTVTVIITNGGSQTVTWPAAVKWPGDNAPALTSSGVDIVSFITIDAGTTIYGFIGGINFS